MLRLRRRARGHFVTLIEIKVLLTMVTMATENSVVIQCSATNFLFQFTISKLLAHLTTFFIINLSYCLSFLFIYILLVSVFFSSTGTSWMDRRRSIFKQHLENLRQVAGNSESQSRGQVTRIQSVLSRRWRWRNSLCNSRTRRPWNNHRYCQRPRTYKIRVAGFTRGGIGPMSWPRKRLGKTLKKTTSRF